MAASVLILSLAPAFLLESLTPCLPLSALLWHLFHTGRQAGSSNCHQKLQMPRPDNWSCLVPLWLRPLHLLLVCSYITPLSDQCGSCAAQETSGSCKAHPVRSSLHECFLVAMLDSPLLFSVFLSDAHTESFLQEAHPELSSTRHNLKIQTKTPCSLFRVSQLLCLHLCVWICVNVPKCVWVWWVRWWGGCQPWLC